MNKKLKCHKASGVVCLAVKPQALLTFLMMGLLIGMAPFSLYASSLTGQKKLTPQIITETFRVYDLCTYSDQSTLYDCRCTAEQFIKLRTANPSGDDIQVFMDLAKSKCVDTSPIAGQRYEECMKDQMLVGTKGQREFFCTCVGREAGYEFARTKNLTQIGQIDAMTKVYKRCGLTNMMGLP